MPTIQTVRNPAWANSERTIINCEIEHSQYGWIPFTASPTDPEEHGRAIFAACESGEFGPIADYVAPPEPPVIAPTQVQMRQARLALLSVGLLDDVDAAIAGITDPVARKAAQIEWEYATTVPRDGNLLKQLAPALGLSETQLDALFIAAEKL